MFRTHWNSQRGLLLALVSLFLALVPRNSQGAETSRRDRNETGAVHLFGLDGNAINPLTTATAKAVVFVFVSTDCPISNRYAPELRRLYEKFAAQDVKFWLVYPDPTETADNIRKHLKDFQFPFGALRDPRHELVKKTKVRVTPEAAVFVPGSKMVYHGRIDDRYVDFGKERPAPTQHDLENVLEGILNGKPISKAETVAIGCYISSL